ncbi:hypothetical protein WH285_07230 [Acinetobacter johnsonii]|uniref:hypothetical protein n=1 Tax=Acinetobacter johnsonii TaxID=40214 RepID=UPI0030B282AE
MEKYIDPVYLNANQGVLALLIFLFGLIIAFFGWIIKYLNNKPKFLIDTIEGPTFACTFKTGRIFHGYEAHITAVVLYLNLKNVGNLPSSIEKIHIAYKWNIIPFSFNWVKYRLGWFWINNQTIALDDFQCKIGDRVKVYPFLTQLNNLAPNKVEKFIEVGKGTNGIVYFEQAESWGAMSPVVKNHKTKIKICIVDSFGKKHRKVVNIPMLELDEALKYNPSFGMTYQILSNEKLG